MKKIVLYILRALGVFYMCRRFIGNKTLILAYHGFEINDESQFEDQLFIKEDTLKLRLDYLKKHCNIIPLSDLAAHNPHKNKVVITVDDGWYSTLSLAAPIFKDYQIPYTVYLTTENVLDNQPIFHVALSYILFRNIGKQLNYKHSSGFKLVERISHDNLQQIVDSVSPIKAQKNDTALLKAIAKSLDFDFDPTIANKALTLVSAKQAKSLHDMGADIQLHTHTHNTPLENVAEFDQEIEVNREHITDIIGIKPEHHCYPSSVYDADSIEHLRRLQVKTATTCYPGLVDQNTELLEAPRFLDSERISQIVFEAEVSGVSELLRNILKGKQKPLSLAAN